MFLLCQLANISCSNDITIHSIISSFEKKKSIVLVEDLIRVLYFIFFTIYEYIHRLFFIKFPLIKRQIKFKYLTYYNPISFQSSILHYYIIYYKHCYLYTGLLAELWMILLLSRSHEFFEQHNKHMWKIYAEEIKDEIINLDVTWMYLLYIFACKEN